ncbi:MAG: Cyclohexadienyl dehydrogenase [Chroococcopsis gigantea SAG 12.99]|jgi:arogenate dehydrogenase (NADP+)|nr:prephenate/arogenate dehydrogenase [Chlorogloea purpurea SAG 13.99]MDV2998610.1 Cyclohexadienyl dehydrogenase [Chroococcopsis gigantea SAG 12.99]
MSEIGIVGLGLIGGSLALDLKALGYHVTGVSRKPRTCEIALEKGMVDRSGVSLDLLSGAEIIFICTPMSLILPTIGDLIPHIEPGTIITDVGSVKGAIVSQATELWPHFVGGHPMAGTSEQGINAAQRDLFKNAPYVITPLPHTSMTGVEKLSKIVEQLGCRLYQCSPEAHDRAVALISHLPVVLGANLIDVCMAAQESELAQNLASSGFRDTSRVGGGNPELGTMMARYNRSALLQSLRDYQDNLTRLMGYIESENWEGLEAILQYTQKSRALFIKP